MNQQNTPGHRAVAYVTVPASEHWRWIGEDTPGQVISHLDTRYVTHIQFAFGVIQAYQFEPGTPGKPLREGRVASREAYRDPTDGKHHYRVTLDGWIGEFGRTVSGGRYLAALSALKAQKPDLKVMLSVGGWESDGFCYMSRTPEYRAEFIQSCIALIREYDLDGIDLDWEFPNNAGWDTIAGCPHDIEDYKALLREMRTEFDRTFSGHKLLSIASGAELAFLDRETFDALDYVCVMCYDYSPGSGGSQADLESAAGYMQAHADIVGDCPETRTKLNLGIPFYNEGGAHLVPYYKEYSGHIDCTPEITRRKMEWVKENGYGGAFYWAYSMDVYEGDTSDPSQIKILQRTVYETLNG